MKVSVLITSYNSEKTLKRAIDSVLMQDFDDFFVIWIDDGSADSSWDIICSYNISNGIGFQPDHGGIMKTYRFGFGFIGSPEYICFCDGDDYWIDPLKLKKQVEFMDSHPDVGMCFTRVITEKDGVRSYDNTSIEELNKGLAYDNILKGNARIYAQSYCIRKSDFDKYVDFDKFVKLKMCVWDFPIAITLSKHTKLAYLDDTTAVFTIAGESITHTHSRIKRLKLILGYHWIRLYFIFKYGCKISTFFYLVYRFFRDLYSVCFHRWDK